MVSVGVVITTIPPRRAMLIDAVNSVLQQTHTAAQTVICCDAEREGVAVIRNRGWRSLDTEWVCFLDDDDVLYPHHIERLLMAAEASDADLVYPWFDVRFRAGQKPFEFMFINGKSAEGHPFDAEARETIRTTCNFIPITVLVRKSMLEKVGGFPIPGSPEWPAEANEDWACWKAMLEAGATFAHLPERTWQWRWHAHHTMGQASRW